MNTTFEEIITEHNDELIAIFVNNAPGDETPFSGMVKIAKLSEELNARTQARLAELFDKTFLKASKIEGA
jgi:hypothetical protein